MTDEEINREYLVRIFGSLREEISSHEERAIKIQTVAISGIPILVALGQKLQLDMLVITSPLVTAVFALMILYIQNSIMRAGKYMREYVEHNLKVDIIGWEDFLELEDSANRTAEAYFLWAVALAFGVYYIAGTLLAFMILNNNYSQSVALIVTFGYASAFLFCLYYFIRNFKANTQ